ncbi:protein ENHANCED DOWNY MILDEW 2-like isoform X2 [Juglans microcarpa x Juglans regia]|uniref:protein ENHANCED DOWNY MILDEW 2-like isoform X2 n=1 Tax=Juglans microcarpa x Juglans regia TaxID=2249226 RepID=UPI001B7E92A0|nr:protein ENHANCED DOWNY MILDEW 2-like isoform X2 [Juglans microcarpa x Juglans regia]
MASSDDEADVLPQWVSNYYFEDDEDEPISFSVLPIQWKEGDIQDCVKEQIFLHGVTDNGLQKIYKHVVAWRFDLSNMNPEISVLSKENNWIKLQKPRKSFEDIIRTIMVTVRCLHFLKKNPEASGKSLWDHLSKVFSLYEVRPSQNDLVDHMPLISEAVNRDETLAKSKFLYTFLKEKPGKRKLSDEDCKKTAMSGFIVYDLDEEEEEDVPNKVKGVYDHVCAFCDNGGNILSCEGRCIRSFHATKEAGAESNCVSLGFASKKEVDELPVFICKNCKYKQHQCFACGKLGSSDKFSGAEVFMCVSATCGYFYHPHCVTKLLHQENKVAAEELEKKIAAGGSFTCPIHKCCVCKRGENKKDHELQFAVCRRCPKSYHRKCLPRKISFGEGKGIVTRAWEDLLPNRILIYCLLLTLMRDAASSITLEEIKEKHTVPFSHLYSSKNNVEKNITIGKLEGSVEAIRTAFMKLEEGCSLEDAEAVCEPDVLRQIFRWKNMLRVYLAPFLNGNRYTSYGRHFTKMEKIEEIVDKLHWYVQNNDMIVDFCCGANDFSILMKKKLEETGKICSYKNYDIFQPKNDFNFEKRDWMTVQPKELPAGSRLIMGLNPPFGVRASLANKFIDKALEFNPKLLILIVPPETQKLDEKKRPYDLIWEDNQSLSGKSFYLPGSVDENDKQMDQWNLITPPLSLWSRRDWTAKHKSIAGKHGHIFEQKEGSDMEKNPLENRIHDHLADGHDRYGDTSMLMDDLSMQSESEKFSGAVVGKCHVERSLSSKGYKENLENDDHGKNQPDKTSTRKRKRDKGKQRKRMGQVSSEIKRDTGKLHHSLSSVVESRFLSESQHSKSREMPSHAETGENGDQHLEPRTAASRMQFATGYGGSQASIPKEMGRMKYISGNEPYSSGTHRG